MPWTGVDLDGTLAEYHGWNGGAIGKPVPRMMRRVRRWLKQGREVRIVTARANALQWGCAGAREQMDAVQDWCEAHGLPRLTVTCEKDYEMEELWDDRCVCVERNTGRVVSRPACP